MYTTPAEYEAYTGGTAPVDYERQELYATTLFKSLYPNFPSEEQFLTLDTATQNCIKYAIFEQISEGINYGGTESQAQSYSVGSFSITDGDTSLNGKVSSASYMYLQTCGATYKGVSGC